MTAEGEASEHDEPDENFQQVRTQYVTARVPDSIGHGVMSTGVILITGANEFVIDFVQNIGPPSKVVARVVLPHVILPQVIGAMKQNLKMFEDKFGAPPEFPKPPADAKRSQGVQDIYDELKIPDELLAGAYANALMIAHTPAEFKLDFLVNLYPHSAVSARIFVSAPQMARMIESFSSTYENFMRGKSKEE